MGMPWNRTTASYRETFLPRFLPYHTDFAAQLGAKPGDRVLVPGCGPGTDAIAFARAVGDGGLVRATDPVPAYEEIVTKRFKDAAVAKQAQFEVASMRETSGAPFAIIASAFAAHGEAAEHEALMAWRDALAHAGKLGVMMWGPSDDDDPYATFIQAALGEAPELRGTLPDAPAVDRASVTRRFEAAGLALVRLTVVRHAQVFVTTDELADALLAAVQWPELANLGETRVHRIRARFLELAGGAGAPLSCQPAATIAIGALPGEEIELPHRPSVRAEVAK